MDLQHQISESVSEQQLHVYIEHLAAVKTDINIRFKDLLEIDIPFWVIQPFSCSAIEYEPVLQEQLIDLQSDVEAQCIFRASGWENL